MYLKLEKFLNIYDAIWKALYVFKADKNNVSVDIIIDKERLIGSNYKTFLKVKVLFTVSLDDFYSIKANIPILRKEFPDMGMKFWIRQGVTDFYVDVELIMEIEEDSRFSS